MANNYALIDAEDVEVFKNFRLHHLRSETEFDESRKLKLPYMVYLHEPEVYSLDPQFAGLVNRRFAEKKAELSELLR